MDLTDRIGCVLTPEGAFFRVWAPHATAVSVAVQDGPEWDAGRAATAQALKRAADDYWSATVPGVRPGSSTGSGSPPPRARSWNGSTRRRATCSAPSSPADRRRPQRLPRTGPGSLPVGAVRPAALRELPHLPVPRRHASPGAATSTAPSGRPSQQVESKLGYIRELGFNCVEPLPVQEYAMDRSWGYNPATLFAPESSYGSPAQLRHFVDAAHRAGLAVIFDVVYNHFGASDNVLWDYDGYTHEGGIYFEGGQDTGGAAARPGGSARCRTTSTRTPACTSRSTAADGLRFDVTTQINGRHLRQRRRPAARTSSPTATSSPSTCPTTRGSSATAASAPRGAPTPTTRRQRALAGQDPVNKVRECWAGTATTTPGTW